jgi:hypothetical protein
MLEVSIRSMVEVQSHQVSGCTDRHVTARCELEKPS